MTKARQKREVLLIVQRSFYIGIAHFLDETYTPTDEEKASQQIANGLYELCAVRGVSAQLVGTSFGFASDSFEWDFATADDAPGLPVLLYLDVQFEIPADEAEKITEAIEDEDGGTLIFATIGHIRILEMGDLEIVDE
jgi:hypothetical protein